MAKRKPSWIVRLSLTLFLLTVIVIGVPVYRRVHAFLVEDQIHAAFMPLIAELYRFETEEGKPPAALTDVVPKYLPTIPKSPLTEAPAYRVLSDGKTWELAIRSGALSRPRVYVWRSTYEFTPEESRRAVQRFHGWAVFAE